MPTAVLPKRSAHPADKDTRYPAALWLNLVCLDAPLVALVWQELFARSLGVALGPGARVALFLTAWLIYLADRAVDTFRLRGSDALSLRQRFCLRNRRPWIVALIFVGAADGICLWNSLDPHIFRPGLAVGAASIAYLSINSLGRAWRFLPIKELLIGALFAVGTFLAPAVVARELRSDILLAFAAFAAVCTLNCIAIAAWECDLDLLQSKESISTRYLQIQSWVFRLAVTIAIVAIGLGVVFISAATVVYCVAVSAALIGILDLLKNHIARDVRTAMADLALLAPVLFILAR